MPRQIVTSEIKADLLELYRCHYSLQEASDLSGLSYPTICSYYRQFREVQTTRYDRASLTEATDFSNLKYHPRHCEPKIIEAA